MRASAWSKASCVILDRLCCAHLQATSKASLQSGSNQSLDCLIQSLLVVISQNNVVRPQFLALPTIRSMVCCLGTAGLIIPARTLTMWVSVLAFLAQTHGRKSCRESQVDPLVIRQDSVAVGMDQL